MTTIRHEGVGEFSGRMLRSRQVVSEELRAGVDRCTALGERGSKQEVGVRTGHLRRSITTSRAVFAGGVARGSWGTNVPYARVHHDGRGPVVATNAKALRFVVNGRVLYRKRVGPAKGNPFLRSVAARLRPRFVREFDVARNRIVVRLAGGR
jgi:hypothetical protein